MFEIFNMSYNCIYCLPLQSLVASDAHLIALSIEHQPSLRELTVEGDCSESLVKGAVEGMARRHDVEKLDMSLYQEGECLLCTVIPLTAILNDVPQCMLHHYTHPICSMPTSLEERHVD